MRDRTGLTLGTEEAPFPSGVRNCLAVRTSCTIHIWLNPLPSQLPRKCDSRMICSLLLTQTHNLCPQLLQAPQMIPNECSHKNGISLQSHLHHRRNQDSPRTWMMPSDTEWAPKSWKRSSPRYGPAVINCSLLVFNQEGQLWRIGIWFKHRWTPLMHTLLCNATDV